MECSPPAANDCFLLGRLSYTEKDFYHTILWMQEALDLDAGTATKESEVPSLDRKEVLDYLSYSLAMVSLITFQVLLVGWRWYWCNVCSETLRNKEACYKIIMKLPCSLHQCPKDPSANFIFGIAFFSIGLAFCARNKQPASLDGPSFSFLLFIFLS